MPQYKLFDKKTLDTLKKHPLYSQDGKGNAAVAYARIFHPMSGATIYLTEYDGDDTFFGYYKDNDGQADDGYSQSEYGYFSKSELEKMRVNGLPMERDSHFKQATMGAIKAGKGQSSTLNMRTNFDTQSNGTGNTSTTSKGGTVG